MDLFDGAVLKALKDERSRNFQRLLGEVGFSHNTLRLHLRRLVDQGPVIREKRLLKGVGRPRFIYSTPPRLRRQGSFIL